MIPPSGTLVCLMEKISGARCGVEKRARICELAGVEGVLRGVILIQSTMPVAVFNYLLAQTYRQGPETVAAMVVLSTLLSFITLPLLLMVALP